MEQEGRGRSPVIWPKGVGAPKCFEWLQSTRKTPCVHSFAKFPMTPKQSFEWHRRNQQREPISHHAPDEHACLPFGRDARIIQARYDHQ